MRILSLRAYKYIMSLQTKQICHLNIKWNCVIIRQWLIITEASKPVRISIMRVECSLSSLLVSVKWHLKNEVVSIMETVYVLCEVGTKFKYGLEMNWSHEKFNEALWKQLLWIQCNNSSHRQGAPHTLWYDTHYVARCCHFALRQYFVTPACC